MTITLRSVKGTRLTHAELDGNFTHLDTTKEATLGNPEADGYVLSSSTAGDRSWVEMGGVKEAPIDGNCYARKDGAWANISAPATPILTVTGAPSDVTGSPIMSSSAFFTEMNDTHLNTDWQIRNSADTATIWESLANASNLVSIKVPAATLIESTQYIFKARHRGTTYSESAWASVVATTTATFNPMVFIETGPGPETGEYDFATDTGYYGYVGTGGEPTYAAGTTCAAGDIVNNGSDEFYYSKVGGNTGNALPSISGENTHWRWIGRGTLITGDALALEAGYSTGTPANSSAGWLKFFVGATAECNPFTRRGEVAEDVVVFIAKKYFRTSTWSAISGGNILDGTNQVAQIMIDDQEYRLRIPFGSDLMAATYECSSVDSNRVEWNSLMYRVHESLANNCNTPPALGSGEIMYGAQLNANWDSFSNADLSIGSSINTVCQETVPSAADRAQHRGRTHIVSIIGSMKNGTTSGTEVWRPVLELK